MVQGDGDVDVNAIAGAAHGLIGLLRQPAPRHDQRRFGDEKLFLRRLSQSLSNLRIEDEDEPPRLEVTG